jgi:FkbM family methyltransferase
MPRGGVAYCFGLGRDIRLERLLAERFELEVLGFDPTPSSVAWLEGQELPARFRHVERGIAGYDGSAFFHASPGPTGSQSMVREHAEGDGDHVEVRRLATLLEAHGHDQIDLLKLDVEGVEYEVIRDMVEAGLRPRIVLVEFHHRFSGIGIEATEEALATLRAHGYGIFHISPSGREHALVLRDAV